MHSRPNAAPLLSRRRLLLGLGLATGSAILAACGEATAVTPTPQAPTTGVTGATPSRAPASAASATSIASAASVPAASPVVSASSATTASATLPTLAIEAFDFGYRTMGSVPAGVTLLQMKNTGKEPHHAQVMRLNPGVDLAQFAAAAMKGPEGIFPVVSFVGGPGAVGPGDTSQAILTLTEGQYLLACFVQGMDMVPHLAKGMVLPLTVTAGAGAGSTALPATSGTITMSDFSFAMPATLPAGKGMYRVVNQGAQVHEFDLYQLLPGKTVDDLKGYFDPTGMPPMGPPPAIGMGGMQGLTKGSEGVLPLDLKPGNYAALCLIPDQSQANGASHLHLGMIKGFTVS